MTTPNDDTTKTEVREWWISGWDRNYQPEDQVVWTVFLTNRSPNKPEAFSVVEKSAFESERARANELGRRLLDTEGQLRECALTGRNNETFTLLQKQRDEARAEIDQLAVRCNKFNDELNIERQKREAAEAERDELRDKYNHEHTQHEGAKRLSLAAIKDRDEWRRAHSDAQDRVAELEVLLDWVQDLLSEAGYGEYPKVIEMRKALAQKGTK